MLIEQNHKSDSVFRHEAAIIWASEQQHFCLRDIA